MPSPEQAENNADTTIASGFESGMVLILFVAGGYALDRWLGTKPIFTLGLFALGAVALFVRFKAQYTIRMDAFAQQRRHHVVDERVGDERTPGGPAS